MLTILHASDLQCGRPFRPGAADALVRFAARLGPNVVVVSGDLTQRAKVREFETARALMARLPRVPVIVTPGNHDVPLYRLLERLLDPYANYRRYAAAELNTVTSVPGATFVALNSSTPLRAIVDGRLEDRQIEFARGAFGSVPASDARVLVIHHHLRPMPGDVGGPPIPRGEEFLVEFEAMGADLILGGHVHQTRLTWSVDPEAAGDRRPIPLVACGTTTSRRGRGVELGRNSLNVVRVADEVIDVVPHLLEEGASDFEPREPVRFARHVTASSPAPRAGGAS